MDCLYLFSNGLRRSTRANTHGQDDGRQAKNCSLDLWQMADVGQVPLRGPIGPPCNLSFRRSPTGAREITPSGTIQSGESSQGTQDNRQLGHQDWVTTQLGETPRGTWWDTRQPGHQEWGTTQSGEPLQGTLDARQEICPLLRTHSGEPPQGTWGNRTHSGEPTQGTRDNRQPGHLDLGSSLRRSPSRTQATREHSHRALPPQPDKQDRGLGVAQAPDPHGNTLAYGFPPAGMPPGTTGMGGPPGALKLGQPGTILW